jgi:putative sigma-54 modulation protein
MTPNLRDHAKKRLEKLGRYYDHIQEAHLILDQEKHRQIAELTVRANGTELISREEGSDMLTSIDRVVDRLERQIKKLNARLKDRKNRRPMEPGVAPVAEEELVEAEPEEVWSPVVVRSESAWHASPVTVEQAIQVLREGENDYVLFRNAKTGKVALVHHRPDGNFGLAEES